MEKFEVYLTYEDAIRLEMARATEAEHDSHYKTMTEGEYISVLIHKFLNPNQNNEENL